VIYAVGTPALPTTITSTTDDTSTSFGTFYFTVNSQSFWVAGDLSAIAYQYNVVTQPTYLNGSCFQYANTRYGGKPLWSSSEPFISLSIHQQCSHAR
jgi:hypothetical protein